MNLLQLFENFGRDGSCLLYERTNSMTIDLNNEVTKSACSYIELA